MKLHKKLYIILWDTLLSTWTSERETSA